ncbi:MAG: GNAT family protein [Bacillus sp. (in: firmicutes)]
MSGNVLLKGKRVNLRSIQEKDLTKLWNLIYGEKYPEWKKWDAPHYPLEKLEYEVYQNRMQQLLQTKEIESRLIIEIDQIIVGTVSFYWEHKPSNWLEMGIVIYDPVYWNGGYGTESLSMWTEYLFTHLPLVRVGLTIWSGNKGMIKVAEKLGMQEEGVLRKCRLYKGEYFDSIRMGILREEWEAARNK